MTQTNEWQALLSAADSPDMLAPEGYDDDVAISKLRTLRDQLIRSLPAYFISCASPELYQDSPGLADCRIDVNARDSAYPHHPPFAWVLFSHFGELATITDCEDGELCDVIRSLLAANGYRYVAYHYVIDEIYTGQCPGYVGRNYLNRFFALAPEYHCPESTKED